MERKRLARSLWQNSRVETTTLGILLAGWMVIRLLGWTPDISSSLVAIGVYLAWIGLCVIVYRYFYRLDT